MEAEEMRLSKGRLTRGAVRALAVNVKKESVCDLDTYGNEYDRNGERKELRDFE